MKIEWIMSLIGGVLIGTSVSLMLLLNGRVAGISGIFNGILAPSRGDCAWRIMFIVGLIMGGAFTRVFMPEAFSLELEEGIWLVVISGVLVGFGTVLGSGCTSGHGVCGVSRLSPRSILATIVFILAGILSVSFFRGLLIK